MADIVNLRTQRKRKARQDKAAKAEANRQSFGQTKAQRGVSAIRKAKAEKDLTGKKLDP